MILVAFSILAGGGGSSLEAGEGACRCLEWAVSFGGDVCFDVNIPAIAVVPKTVCEKSDKIDKDIKKSAM